MIVIAVNQSTWSNTEQETWQRQQQQEQQQQRECSTLLRLCQFVCVKVLCVNVG
jgi:hypothetical protein